MGKKTILDALLRQRELQDKLEYKPTRGELVVALIAELGEVLNAGKGAWAWWKRDGKPFDTDKDKLVDELADMLHFALAIILKDGRIYNDAGELDATPLVSRDTGESKDIPDVIRKIIDAAGSVRYSRRLVYLTYDLGKYIANVDGDTILTAYFKKADENEKRWESAREKRRRKKR